MPEPTKDIYIEMRDAALAFQPDPESDQMVPDDTLIGIVIDWAMDDGIATIVCMNEGSASMYWSSGGGIIGAGENPAVAPAAKAVLLAAQRDRQHFAPVDTADLPEADHMRFTLVTTNGLLSVVDDVETLAEQRSPISDLGNQVQALIFEINRHGG